MSTLSVMCENGEPTQRAVTAGTADLIAPTVPRDPRLAAVVFVNNSADRKLWLRIGSPSDACTYADGSTVGTPIAPGGDLIDQGSIGPWHVFGDGGPVDCRITEVRRPYITTKA